MQKALSRPANGLRSPAARARHGSLYRDPLSRVRFFQALTNFRHEPLVGQDGKGFLETLEVIGTDQNQDRTAITSDYDSFLLLLDSIGYLGEMCLDSCKRHCLTHDQNYSHILPPAWQIGLDETFLAGMANAMTFVTKGLTDADWEGPANTAEELCLKAILDHASEVIPEVWKIEDRARLKADVMDLREIGFQHIDHEFLFEPETDGIDQSDLGAQMGMQSLSRRDAFKPFEGR